MHRFDLPGQSQGRLAAASLVRCHGLARDFFPGFFMFLREVAGISNRPEATLFDQQRCCEWKNI